MPNLARLVLCFFLLLFACSAAEPTATVLYMSSAPMMAGPLGDWFAASWHPYAFVIITDGDEPAATYRVILNYTDANNEQRQMVAFVDHVPEGNKTGCIFATGPATNLTAVVERM